MTTKKLTIAAAVSAALCGSSAISYASMTGIPGEALLVPLVMSSDPGALNTQVETYVSLYVPEAIGQDTIINGYTALHAVPSPGVDPQVLPANPRIYWTLFDENSREVEDGTCEISLGDKVVWTTDVAVVQAAQAATRLALGNVSAGRPDPECGPSGAARLGYVIFQTEAGQDGLDADYAFWGNAYILETWTGGIGTVPVMAMSDGADPSNWPTTPTTLPNNVVMDTLGAPHAAPITTGIRMNNADGDDADTVRMQAEIRGPQTGNEISLHAFWFDRNQAPAPAAARIAGMTVWDDHEGNCTDTWPFPDEVNVVIYNCDVVIPVADAPPQGWGNLFGAACNTPNRGMIDLGNLLTIPPGQGYTNGTYCEADYWAPQPGVAPPYLGAANGYVEYEFLEFPNLAGPGLVDSAAVAFNWQQSLGIYTATGVAATWSSHMTTDLGKFN